MSEPLCDVVLLNQPGVEPDDAMGEAGRKIWYFHFQEMLSHEPAVRQGQDPEAIHDMRVATRRMRAAFGVFGTYFDPECTAPYLRGLKRTGRALGAARDLDVLIKNMQAYVNTLPESERGSLDGLLAIMAARRQKAQARMLKYLDGAGYAQFKAGFGEFAETVGWGSLPIALQRHDPQPYRVRHVAPMTIYQRLAAVRAYDEWVRVPDPPLVQLHELRIACKSLRYTLEFFREVLGPSAKMAIKEIVTVQDHLGDLQDATITSSILRDLIAQRADPSAGNGHSQVQAPASVDLAGMQAYLAARQADLYRLVVTFPQVWQQLNEAAFSQMVAEAVAVL
jgi:CHAD domain-containing protein